MRYFLGDFVDKKAISRLLRAKDLSVEAAHRIAGLYDCVAQALISSGESLKAVTEGFWVPGRIEVLGKHTDYAGGSSLLVAVERGFSVLLIPKEENKLTFFNVADQQWLVLNWDGEIIGSAPSWSLYPVAAVKRLTTNFGSLQRGGVLAFKSDLPIAAGMSSSSAFIVATSFALQSLTAFEETPIFRANISKLTQYADFMGHVENGQTYKELAGDRGVGTFGGSQDHTAILCAQSCKIMHAQFKPTRIHKYVDLPSGFTFCIGVSGVKAEKTEGARTAYNQAAERACGVLEVWNQSHTVPLNSLAEIVQAPVFEKDIFLAQLSRESAGLSERFTQFYRETTLHIPEAIKAFETSDLSRLGKVVDASQADAERYLKNQILETTYLAQSAKRLDAVAASAFGAGFGGAVWALVKKSDANAFLKQWRSAYHDTYPTHTQAQFFQDQTGPAAFRF